MQLDLDWNDLPPVDPAEPTSSSAPRLSGEFSSVALRKQHGAALTLACLAQGFPAPLFRYFIQAIRLLLSLGFRLAYSH